MSHNKIEDFAKKLYKQSLTAGHVDPLKVKEITAIIRSAKDSDTLALLKNYTRKIEFRIYQETAFVESPFAADGVWEKEVEKKIHDQFPEVNYVHFVVNPSLIAGIKLQIADLVYENSIKAKLNNLRKLN